MSWHYSRALVEAYSAANCSDGEQSARSSGKSIPQAYCSPDRMTATSRFSRFGMTFAPLTDDRGEDLLTWFRAGFPAKTLAQPERAQESKESGLACGERWQEWFARWDRDSSLWRTRQCSLVEGLDVFSETWPKWGMMRGGACSEQSMPAPRTSENESGLWLTPRATESGENPDTFVKRMGDRTDRCAGSLSAQVKNPKTWPTPAARDCKGANSREHCETNGTGRKHLDQLANAVMYPDLLGSRANVATTGGATSTECTPENATAPKSTSGNPTPTQWATPQARDFRSGQTIRFETKNRPSGAAASNNLNDQVGGQLNPTWVEWLMGWPLGWTGLKPLETAKYQAWLRSHGGLSTNRRLNHEHK